MPVFDPLPPFRSVPRPAGTRPLLTGGFLQLNATCLTEPATAMPARLAAMAAVGMDTVVIQYCAYNGLDLGPAVDRVFDAAEALGMRVWFGGPYDDACWWGECWSPWFLSTFGPVAAMATYEAVCRVADRPALAGVYLPYETNGLAWPWAMGDFFGRLSRSAKRAKPGVPVMISPFTNLVPGAVGSLPPEVLGPWWDVVLACADLDVLAWQDGVGACTAQLGQVNTDLGALAWATRRHGVRLWADTEVFLRTTPLEQPFAATAAPFDRVRRQLEAEAPWVERLIAFDFNDYMDPAVGADQRHLYTAYQAYRDELA
jgi:hypothetical protein